MEGKLGSILEQGNEQKEKPEVKVFFIRHSRATYATYAEKVGSENPESPIDVEKQLPDLPEIGIEMAHKAAREFLGRLNPVKDTLYVVSSSQMRALETAKIYIDEALERGFEVVRHEQEQKGEIVSKTGTELAGEVGDGYIRTLEGLSLHMENQIHGAIFNAPAHMPEINWEQVSPETKVQFEEARKIVLTDERGSWGANFAAHAEAIRNIIPELETPKGLYQTQYQDLMRLADFARKRVSGTKRVNIIAFGHENYMGYALEHDTHDERIGNVEAVELGEDGYLKRL